MRIYVPNKHELPWINHEFFMNLIICSFRRIHVKWSKFMDTIILIMVICFLKFIAEGDLLNSCA